MKKQILILFDEQSGLINDYLLYGSESNFEIKQVSVFNMQVHCESDRLGFNSLDKKTIINKNYSKMLPLISCIKNKPLIITIAKQLELLGLYSVQPLSTIEFIWDKFRIIQLLTANNIKCVPSVLLTKPLTNKEILTRLGGFPIVCFNYFPSLDSKGIICNSRQMLQSALELMLNKNKVILLQQYKTCDETDKWQILVFKNKVIAWVFNHMGKHIDYSLFTDSNYKVLIPSHIVSIALNSVKICGFNYARVEIFSDEFGDMILNVDPVINPDNFNPISANKLIKCYFNQILL